MVRSRKSAARNCASRIGRALGVVTPLAAVYIAAFPAAALAQVQELPAIQVIANTPLQGSGVDRDKIPSTTYSVDAADFQRTYSPNVTALRSPIPMATASSRKSVTAASPLRRHRARRKDLPFT
jgi:hypothetical protein